jgi:hypothetical protein
MTEALASAFVALLKADPAVTAICGTRIFPELAPDKTPTPYVVWLEVSTSTEESHDEAQNLDATDVQFSCFDRDLLTSINLRKAVRHALLTTPMSGVKVIQPILRSLPESELRLSNSVLDVTFMHNPTN